MLKWFKQSENLTLGQRSERYAKRFLKKSGYRIMGVNVKSQFGEVDILAWDKKEKMAVVVEVKSSTTDVPGPEIHVNFQKQKKLTKMAYWLMKQAPERYAWRFDVIAIVWPEEKNKPSRCTHIVSAFEAVY